VSCPSFSEAAEEAGLGEMGERRDLAALEEGRSGKFRSRTWRMKVGESRSRKVKILERERERERVRAHVVPSTNWENRGRKGGKVSSSRGGKEAERRLTYRSH